MRIELCFCTLFGDLFLLLESVFEHFWLCLWLCLVEMSFHFVKQASCAFEEPYTKSLLAKW